MLRLALWMILATCGAARANDVQVVTDVAPIASLTALVMGDTGVPTQLVPDGASPHDHQLRPSDARRLSQADLVIWIGPNLTPWLEKALGSLAPDARKIVLSDLAITQKLPTRSAKDFGDDGDEQQNDIKPGEVDPHLWLDPENASRWVAVIAEHLGTIDPKNSDVYRRNAMDVQARLAALSDEIRGQINGARFVAYHDSYQYFQSRFGATTSGTIAASDANDPSPRAIARARALLQDGGCILTDGSANLNAVATVSEGLDVRVVSADPLGFGIAPGPERYFAMMRAIAQAMSQCK